jgi:hypothetical protein
MSVCDDQDTFNKSFRSAVKYVEKKEKPGKTVMTIAVIIYVFFTVWALMLASRMPSGEKTEHTMFALLFSPAYIISYYIGM